MADVMHGGRALEFARVHNLDYRDVVDFSANINPLGPSPKAIEAIRNGLDRVQAYPDENPVCLVDAISRRIHVPVRYILAGNGATELLYFWLRTLRPRTATLVVPTFTEYRKALEAAGTEVHTIQLDEADHFRIPRTVADTDVIIITNPNNPTASYAPPEEMLDWLRGFPASTQLFVDEAFVDFTAQRSLVLQIERLPNLWVLRSMTKFYALPGLRLGFLAGLGVPSAAKRREPWQVNTLAELAGIASLEDQAYQEATMQLIQRERIWMWKQLQDIPGIQAFPSVANFFLIRAACDATLDQLIEEASASRMLIRDCRDIEGLDGPFFRIAIKTRLDNERLLHLLDLTRKA
jgi:threonine-phosphate decarboxylase